MKTIQIEFNDEKFDISWDSDDSKQTISDILNIVASDYAHMLNKLSPQMAPKGTSLH